MLLLALTAVSSEACTELDPANVRRDFRRLAVEAGPDDRMWTPRELRRSFVSLLSDGGVPSDSHGPRLPGPPAR